MATNSFSFIVFDDIEDQLKEIFTGNEIINLTRTYAESVGKEVPIKVVNFNSKKDIITANLGVLTVSEKIEFLSQVRNHSKVLQDAKLCKQIDKLISGVSKPTVKSRNSITDLLSDYPQEIVEQWKKSYAFYDQSDYRNALDTIRLTIELLVKYLTDSDKSLENQQKILGEYLKNKGISKSIRTLFFKMLDMYLKVQNNNSKHNLPTNLSYEEITLLMNQSTVIIKFLVDCDEKKKINYE